MDDDDGDVDVLSFAYQVAMRAMFLQPFIDQILREELAQPTGGGTVVGGAPASEEAIRALKDVAITEGGDQPKDVCAICLEETAAAAWKEMPCGHQFHGACLEKWLRMHGTCPMCRHQMPTAPAAEVEVVDALATSDSILVMIRVRSPNDDGAAPVEHNIYDDIYQIYEIPFVPSTNP
ncbi:E3 ubiquitin-protein ligase RING1 [Oryza brachyantha]|uniref:E3 ubiquitin-protein ligase RING1 n=1 Tax=Oryza brachyantha TaxID=4533 RepID=UPI001ADB73C5|nr:E3 ubiquitin-protein ligase RING1 [Oryza brachyantha]